MIYLDNAATTKPDENCVKNAERFIYNDYFNPSALYSGGLLLTNEIKTAKENILKCLSSLNHEVIFTSCGTESDNLAVFGAVKRGVFVTTSGEHSAVFNSFSEIKRSGKEIAFIPLNKDGSVSTDALFDFIKQNENVSFVSVVHVNNETGAINDINYIAKTVKSINPKIVFHSDGVQAFGKIPYKLSNDIDLYSVSAHKINALKGTGALIKKKNLNLSPIIFGGGQEKGIRSGTENVFGIKTFEYCALSHYKTINNDYEKVNAFKNKIIKSLDKDIFEIISSEKSSPYILSVSAKGLRGEVLMHTLELNGIIVGNGSACSSRNRYSRVISACGYDKPVLDGVIRISFSNQTIEEEIETFIKTINAEAKKLKGIMG